MNKKAAPARKIISENRKAFHNYFVEEKIEAGIVLTGSEVKSLRLGKANISDAYASPENAAIYLINLHISEYDKAKNFNHDPKRPRKLLMHKSEVNKLSGLVQRRGYTLVALAIYFNPRGLVKVELGLGKGKASHDKRETSKQRDWQRDKQRIMKSSS